MLALLRYGQGSGSLPSLANPARSHAWPETTPFASLTETATATTKLPYHYVLIVHQETSEEGKSRLKDYVDVSDSDTTPLPPSLSLTSLSPSVYLGIYRSWHITYWYQTPV